MSKRSDRPLGLHVFAVVFAAAVITVAYIPLAFDVGVSSARPSAPGDSADSVSLYIDLDGLKVPQTYLAVIDVMGWRDSARRTLDARITSAELLDPVSASSGAPSAMRGGPYTDNSNRLVGRRVLASVSEGAAERIGASGQESVRLVVVPKRGAAVVAVDRVVARGTVSALPVTRTSLTGAVAQSLSTYAAPPGANVTVDGRGFGAEQRDSWVAVCGARADVVSWSDTAVSFVVPDGAVRPGYVGVVVGGVTSNGLYFVPHATPAVTSISPREGGAGTVATLEGSGFGATQVDGWVSFGGLAGQVLSWSDTRIAVVVPRGVTPGYVGVVARGMSSNGVFFTPYGHPVVDSVSSRHVLVGERVVLTGRDFGSEPGQVVLGGVPVEVESWSGGRVAFVVPSDARSGYAGVVRGGLTSNGVFVSVSPRLSGLSAWWGEPGSELVLTGEGFGATQGDKRVTFSGVSAPVVGWSGSVVRVQVPAGATSGYVGVGTPGSSSNGIYFVVETPARISSVDATQVAPGQQVAVSGTGFGTAGPGSVAVIAAAYPCEVVSWSDDSILARIPPGAPSGYLGVVKQGIASNGVWLNVAP
ncbi:MAG: hypothetical protein C0418_00620 [Coriobacteriaceae bacterium]|nr:hypothetical protein [Coriobacteriaceae bacterium]